MIDGGNGSASLLAGIFCFFPFSYSHCYPCSFGAGCLGKFPFLFESVYFCLVCCSWLHFCFEEAPFLLGFFSSAGSHHLLSRWASTTPFRPKQRFRIYIAAWPQGEASRESLKTKPQRKALRQRTKALVEWAVGSGQ